MKLQCCANAADRPSCPPIVPKFARALDDQNRKLRSRPGRATSLQPAREHHGQKHKALIGQIDRTVREHAPAGWKGDPVREREVKNVLFPLFNRDRDATLAMFEIIKNQSGY